MTRVRWLSLSAAAAVGAAAGFAVGTTVGRAAPPAVQAAAGDDAGRTAPAHGEAPALAATGAPPPVGDRLVLDLRRDAGLAWAQFEVLLSTGRFEEAAVAGAAYCRCKDAQVRAVEARVTQLDRPADRLRVYDAMRAAGIAIPEERREYDALLALTGRAADVLRGGPDAMSWTAPDVFRALVAEALQRGFDDGATRAVAVRDEWPAWKLQHLADALTTAKHPSAAAWTQLATQASTAETKRAETQRTDERTSRLAEAREAIATRPDAAEAWTGLGDVLREAVEDHPAAADAYERALELDPFSAGAAEALASIAPERLLPRIRERWRELPDDERLMILAATLLRTGHGEEAATTFFRCRELDSAWLRAGLASLAPGPALASIDTRLALADDDTLRLARVDALAALGRVAEAREALAPLVDEDGFSADTWQRLLALDPARAIAIHDADRAAIGVGEGRRVFLADALRRVGRTSDARALVAPFTAAKPDWPTWEFVAPLLAALDPETRLAPLEARTRDPEEQDDARPWATLAEAYDLLGRTADARRAYDEAIAREPDDMPLRIRRLRLR